MKPTNRFRWLVKNKETYVGRTKADYVIGPEKVLQQWFDPECYDRKTDEPEPHGWRDIEVVEE